MKALTILFLAWILPFFALAQQTGFQLLSAKASGIQFENTVTDEVEHNILIYSNYYGGAGVGVADFNQDGLQDIVFAGNLVADRLYLNKGDLKFEDVTEEVGFENNGGWSSGVAIADVNNDGWPDIYLTRELYDNKPGLRANKLYINNGIKPGSADLVSFTEKSVAFGVADEERTRHAAFFDYDNDGYADLLLLNQPPNPGNYSELFGMELMQPQFAPKLFRNINGQSFENISAQAGINTPCFPNSLSTTDLNNDGWTDIFIANDYDAPDMIFYNNGDGTFTNIVDEATNHISYYSMGVDAADIDNDGWMDVMVLDMVAEDNYRLKANMSGMNPDAFWKLVDKGAHYQYMFNSLHFNNRMPQISFSDIGQMAGVSNTDWSWSNLIADFDNDGFKDIHVTNGLLRDIRNSDAAKSFPKYVTKVINQFIEANPDAGDVSIWDVLDLKEAMEQLPSEPLSNYMFKNNGDLTFTKVTKDWNMDQKTFSNGSAYADFDNDGDLDLVISNINERAYLYRNQAIENTDVSYLRVQLTDNQNHRTILGSKLHIVDEMGNEQWYEFSGARGMYSVSENIAHFGLGNAKKVKLLEISWKDGSQTRLEDLQANQLIKVDYSEQRETTVPKSASAEPLFSNITSESNLNHRHSENEFDDFQIQVLLPHKMSSFGPGMATGDVNGDGLDDVFVGASYGKEGILYFQTKEGQFEKAPSTPWSVDKMCEDLDAVFFDADGDADLDLYVVSGGNEYLPESISYQDRLYLNDGQGQFTKSKTSLPLIKESGACIRPYDFDQDGDLDLFLGGRHVPHNYPMPANSYLLVNEGGVFTNSTQELAPGLNSIGMVTDAVWSDYNQDGRVDLIVVGEWMGINVFTNENGNFRQSEPIENTRGWWYSIEANDMDGDGDDDYLVGNLGLNYKYKASEDEPFEVHYYDFDDNGFKDIVLSYYNFGEQFPLRGRACSSQQVPLIKDKFINYDLFASANLTEVYGQDNLKKALHYEATNFASIYLENLGNGQFKSTPLPNKVQVSSINDFVVDDFNQDGFKDVLLAGNLFPAEVETTRNDAGVGSILVGDGKGNFTPLTPEASGIFLPYDVKSLKLLKTGKKPLVLGAVNNGMIQILKANY